MQKFCHNCGKQLAVGANFCSSCGVSLSSLTNKPPTAATEPSTSQFPPFVVGKGSDDDDDDSYLDRMTHVDIRQSELQVEIIKDRPLGESVGALISQAIQSSGPPTIEPARPPLPTSKDNKAFLEEFKKEAGTSRNEK